MCINGVSWCGYPHRCKKCQAGLTPAAAANSGPSSTSASSSAQKQIAMMQSSSSSAPSRSPPQPTAPKLPPLPPAQLPLAASSNGPPLSPLPSQLAAQKAPTSPKASSAPLPPPPPPVLQRAASGTGQSIRTVNTSAAYVLLKKLSGDNGACCYALATDAKVPAIVWKPTTGVVALAEIGASALANYITSGLVPVAVAMGEPKSSGGGPGIAQPWASMEPLAVASKVQKRMAFSGLTTDQAAQLFSLMISDWVCSNWDTHSENYGILKSDGKTIIGIDKGQAFKFFRGDKLKSKATGFLEPGMLVAESVPPRMPNIPVYPSLLDWLKQSKDTGKAPTLDHPQVQGTIQRCLSLTPADLQKFIGSYATEAWKTDANQFLQEVLNRAHGVDKEAARYLARGASQPAKTQDKSDQSLPKSDKQLQPSTGGSGPAALPSTALPPPLMPPPPSAAVAVATYVASKEDLEAFKSGVVKLGSWADNTKAMTKRIEDNLKEYPDMKVPAEWSTLLDEEKLAIWLYTKQYYKFWNRAIFENDRRAMAKYKHAFAVFKSGLHKLPIYDGEVYRYDNKYETRHDAMTKGADWTVAAFLSTTRAKNAVSGSGQFGNAVTVTVARGHLGHLIEFASERGEEREVLFEMGSKFKIDDRSGDPKKQQSVELKARQIG